MLVRIRYKYTRAFNVLVLSCQIALLQSTSGAKLSEDSRNPYWQSAPLIHGPPTTELGKSKSFGQSILSVPYFRKAHRCIFQAKPVCLLIKASACGGFCGDLFHCFFPEFFYTFVVKRLASLQTALFSRLHTPWHLQMPLAAVGSMCSAPLFFPRILGAPCPLNPCLFFS